ncbi:hypothetical protein CAPTEDRAFT_222886 [Capitella teleta]|uniref:SRCR domain-containing protein n=1 Tax=Capitella teleta TaxID=283909 RepID=R7U9D7_CAPTE|nr:hypothetical protein CAPTEDRAFT_222886 [Capitella teleta]|eukprot:ELU02940.1 hypothetical protein CAPTEDRAFT_222886 [Capitella teleta]
MDTFVFTLFILLYGSSMTCSSHLQLSKASMLYGHQQIKGKISVMWKNESTSTEAIYFCDDEMFDHNAGNVVCRELEYDEAHLQPSVAGSGSWTIHSVQCDGDEVRLEDCSWTVEAKSQCQLNVVLKCYNHPEEIHIWKYVAIPIAFIGAIFIFSRKYRTWHVRRFGQRSNACRPPTANVCVATVCATANQASRSLRPQASGKNQVDPSALTSTLPPQYSTAVSLDTLPPPPAYDTLYSPQDQQMK